MTQTDDNLSAMKSLKLLMMMSIIEKTTNTNEDSLFAEHGHKCFIHIKSFFSHEHFEASVRVFILTMRRNRDAIFSSVKGAYECPLMSTIVMLATSIYLNPVSYFSQR